MKDQNYKNARPRLGNVLKQFVIGLCVLLTITFASASKLSAQNSTTSTPTSNGTVVTINGQRYVLVAEKTFGKIELMVDELPALRDENQTLKKEKANADQIITKQTELSKIDQQTIGALTNALAASERATAAEKEANQHLKDALETSKAETERQKKRANKWRNIAVASWIVTAAVKVFGL